MLHRVPFRAAHGSDKRGPSSASVSSTSRPRSSILDDSSRLASSTSANNEPSQQRPHRVQRMSVRLVVGTNYDDVPWGNNGIRELAVSQVSNSPKGHNLARLRPRTKETDHQQQEQE